MQTRSLPVTSETSNPSRPERPLLLTVVEAAQALGIGRSTIYELIARGEIETVHIGRSVRIPADAVETYVCRLRALAARGDRHGPSVLSKR